MRRRTLVVGAGSAGCVVAARLSEDPTHDVVVIETGPDHMSSGSVEEPAAITGASFFEACAEPGRLHEDLWSIPVVGADTRPYGRGRGVGGSSSVNAMVALTGHGEDYDAWERDYGCEGWGADVMMPVLDGLLARCHRPAPGELGGLDRALLIAGATLGAEPVTLTRDANGRRMSAAAMMLDPVRDRPNLTVRPEATVDRVLFRGETAVGVRLVDGEEIEASEIVLCAGAVHSPAILKRSGVDLEGIGENLRDHASCGVTLAWRDPVDPSSLAVGAIARFSSGFAAEDLQLLPLNHLGRHACGFGSLAAALMVTRSRGRLVIDPEDAGVHPVLELRLLDDERDRLAMLEGVRRLREVLEHPALTTLVTGMYLDDVGTPLDSLGDDPDAIDTWVRSRTGDYVHASGTCRMGPVEDPTAVVDTRCRVHGTRGVRVVDASVMPTVPRANTHLPVTALAEVAMRRWRD